MSKVFDEVVKAYKPIVKLTHKQTVTRMYRSALRNILHWAENRDLFNEEARKVRAEFDAEKHHSPESSHIQIVMRNAAARLARHQHPDPYIMNYMPGGTQFMRNPAPPLEMVYPDGIPAHYSRRRLNIDMSYVPDDQPYADKVFVDSVNKKYWIDRA